MTDIKKIKELAKEIDGTHKFLSEDLLIPLVNHCDGMRITMFDTNLPQIKVLANPNFPNVFTNFENLVGKYSTSYKRASRRWKIIGKFKKNKYNYLYILQDDNNNIECVMTKLAERLTERYGYKYNNYIDEKNVNDYIEKDEVLYASTTYDKDMNFCYGTNLKACFLSSNNMTYEDAILIREGAIDKLDTYSADEIIITINTNDILLNIYGNNKKYKCIPDIGEKPNSSILAVRRRINYESLLYELNDSNVQKPNLDSDTFFFVSNKDSIVYDINVYCNSDLTKIAKYSFNEQILHYYAENVEYYNNVLNFLKNFIDNDKYNCSSDINYIYRRYSDLVNPNTQFKYDSNTFDNIVLEIKTLNRKKLTVGMKLTGRYGSKGVISNIVPDSDMPVNQYGEIADLCLNPTGVIGRLNLAQLFEQELNFIADNVLRQAKDIKDKDEKFNYIIGFYDIANPKQSAFLKRKWSGFDDKAKEHFLDQCYTRGLYIHEPPFFGGISFEGMIELYEKFKVEPYKCTIKGKPIETPLIFGNIYYLLLKHDPGSKFSARSVADLSLTNIPSKSNAYKSHNAIFSRTPVRCGEMEFISLLLTKNMKLVSRFIAQTSTNPDERRNFSKKLLTENVFNIEKIDLIGSKSITSQIVRIQLLAISLVNKRDENDKVDLIENLKKNISDK